MQRSREAWMLDLCFWKDMTDLVPLAIQIELYFSIHSFGIQLSPFTCAYYLQFLCYHEMNDSENRRRALQQLIDVASDEDKHESKPYISLNIAGHCLLVAGDIMRARHTFYKSYWTTILYPPLHKSNSAHWYLQNFC